MPAWGIGRMANVADLSTTTVAALIPGRMKHGYTADERIEQVNFDHPASVVGITGKVSQFARMVKRKRRVPDNGERL